MVGDRRGCDGRLIYARATRNDCELASTPSDAVTFFPSFLFHGLSARQNSTIAAPTCFPSCPSVLHPLRIQHPEKMSTTNDAYDAILSSLRGIATEAEEMGKLRAEAGDEMWTACVAALVVRVSSPFLSSALADSRLRAPCLQVAQQDRSSRVVLVCCISA